jgi:diadenylate cyclase
LSRLDAVAVFDILLVALIFYAFVRLIQGTQAVQLLRGVIVVVLATAILTSVLRLSAFSWLISKSVPALLLAVPVIFQPELRRALERVGRASSLGTRQATAPNAQPIFATLARACKILSDRRHGALIVLERETGLQEYVDTGVGLDAAVTPELILTVFFPNTPLHDGALIVRADRAVAAGCVLPLAASFALDYHLGTRHRAAIGVTEQTDAIAIVVSEETGIISVAHNGRMIRRLDEARLAKVLQAVYAPRLAESVPPWVRRRGRRVRDWLGRVRGRIFGDEAKQAPSSHTPAGE